MRRIAIGVALVGAGLLVGRRVAPSLHHRVMAGCERMFEQMPDDFPPKRMMRSLEEIQANTTRAVELLEERQSAAGGPELRGNAPSATAVGHAT